MTAIKFDNETIKIISMFEGMTRLSVKDFVCLNDEFCFVVSHFTASSRDRARAFGKRIGRRVRVIKWDTDMNRFVKNMIPSTKDLEVSRAGGERIAYLVVDMQDRGKAIGVKGKNIKLAKEMLARHYGISDLKMA